MSQSLTCSAVTGERSFDALLKKDIRFSALKAALNLEDGSMIAFGGISSAGTGPLVRLHGKINTTVYKEILEKHVPNLRTAINQPAVFMQDNILRHTEKSVKTFLSEDVSAMEWPAQSHKSY